MIVIKMVFFVNNFVCDSVVVWWVRKNDVESIIMSLSMDWIVIGVGF